MPGYFWNQLNLVSWMNNSSEFQTGQSYSNPFHIRFLEKKVSPKFDQHWVSHNKRKFEAVTNKNRKVFVKRVTKPKQVNQKRERGHSSCSSTHDQAEDDVVLKKINRKQLAIRLYLQRIRCIFEIQKYDNYCGNITGRFQNNNLFKKTCWDVTYLRKKQVE